MKFNGFKRYRFKGNLWLPKENTESSTGGVLLTFEKEVYFDFTDELTSPRQQMVSNEPFPRGSHIMVVTDLHGVQPMQDSEWEVKLVLPIIGPMGAREAYRHQVTLYNNPSFGYDGLASV